MNLRDFEYVVAVAEENHFGRAALRCNVSQPALSAQIRKLEDYLEVTLFERTNRSVKITPVGEQILAQARELIMISNEILAIAQSARDPFSGDFRLGMISTIAPYLSPYILSKIRQDLPNIKLHLIEGQTAHLEIDLLGGELDGAILATKPSDRHFKEVDLYNEPFWVALPKKHPLAKNKKIDLTKIQEEDLLLLSDGHCLRDQMLDICHTSTESHNTNTRETSLETLLALVESGDGVTLIPALSIPRKGGRHSNIVTRQEASGGASRQVRFVTRASSTRSELEARLCSIISDCAPSSVVKNKKG